jgi:hypothetical protein
MEAHPFVCPASRCTYGFTGHVSKAYVSDSNKKMVAYWSVYGDFSPTLYNALIKTAVPLKYKPLSRPKLYADGNIAKEAKTLFGKLQSEAPMANVYDY